MSFIKNSIPRLVLILGVVLCWAVAIGVASTSRVDYSAIIKQIEEGEELETYKSILDSYDTMIDAFPNDISWYQRKATAYQKLGWDKAYVAQYKTIVGQFPDDPDAYEKLAQYYDSYADREEIFKLCASIPDEIWNSEIICEIYDKYEYTFEYISNVYTYAEPITVNNAVVALDDSYGYINIQGQSVIGSEYQDARAFFEGIAAVKSDDEWYLVDIDGDRVYASKDNIEELYSPSQGYTAACVDGTWGYYDEHLRNPTHFEYEEATAFLNGVAAVKKDGKWAIIDTSFKYKTDFIFTDVIVDEVGVCSRKLCVFADDGNGYGLYDTDGNRIGSETFSDAKLFRDTVAAVCKNGKWGYIDSKGNKVIDYKFDDAGSFMKDIAPACKDGLWGYIDKTGAFVVDPQFSGATVVSAEGVAAVGVDDSYQYLKFYKYSV